MYLIRTSKHLPYYGILDARLYVKSYHVNSKQIFNSATCPKNLYTDKKEKKIFLVY